MKNFYVKFKTFVGSELFRKILIGIGGITLALLIFQAGMFVGYRKAAFSYRFGDNYHRMFEARESRLPRAPGEFIGGHGAFGKIVSIRLPTFVVVGKSGLEKIVLLNNDTRLRYLNREATSTDLKIGGLIVVFGAPNDRTEIEARFIRLLPPR